MCEVPLHITYGYAPRERANSVYLYYTPSMKNEREKNNDELTALVKLTFLFLLYLHVDCKTRESMRELCAATYVSLVLVLYYFCSTNNEHLQLSNLIVFIEDI